MGLVANLKKWIILLFLFIKDKKISSPLKEYLDYYKTIKEPNYAVLATGEWGTGKTFQVKKALKEDERYYVSLYGLQTVEEIHSNVLAEVDPKLALATSFVNGLDDTAKNIGGLFALGSPFAGLMKARLQKDLKPDRVLIFDDLERCGLGLNDTLGVINTYVEHHGFQVVVIAHDDKIVSKIEGTEEFKKTKEKIFGQAIKIKPQTEQVFDVFCKEVSNIEKHKFIKKHKNLIISTFNESGEKSLRILRHLIEDLARLYECLDGVHLKNKKAMNELVGLFSALNIEVRAGAFDESDLEDREHKGMRYSMSIENNKKKDDTTDNEDIPIFLKSNKKYLTVDLESNLLQDKVLKQMLVDGLYDKNAIRQSLNDSHYFIEPKVEPPWKMVSKFQRLEDEIVDEAILKMNQQFENREVIEPGEMLHIFSLRLMMVKMGELETTASEQVKAAKLYIDDLLEKNKLPPKDYEADLFLIDGYGGYSFYERNSEGFTEIFNYLNKARQKALENSLPEKAKELLELMKTDSRAFFEQVTITNNGPNPYALLPALMHIDAQEFVDVWLKKSMESLESQSYIRSAMQGRYDSCRLKDELSSEKGWVKEVAKLIDEAANKKTGLKSQKIKNIFPSELRNRLDKKPE